MITLPTDSIRWTHRRKLVVLYAIENGHLSTTEALLKYGLSENEIEEWSELVANKQSLHARTRRVIA